MLKGLGEHAKMLRRLELMCHRPENVWWLREAVASVSSAYKLGIGKDVVKVGLQGYKNEIRWV